jgi:hypothetical protein
MSSIAKFEVKICYYRAREKLVTHILNVNELSKYLETTPYNVRDYFAERLNTTTELEGETLKVKGLLKMELLDVLIEEICETI